VLLAGSWARGDAHEASDIDLWVIGGRRERRPRILEREGHMVTVSYHTAAEARREMRNAGRLEGAVPGWRIARILRDPRGVAARLKAEARQFRWASLRSERDRFIAEQLAGWAEEVAKLLRAMHRGERETAAVQRNLLANHMAFLRLLPLERLWDTENGLWERAADWAGPRFASAQRSALGSSDGYWAKTCEGALRLYSLTARANLGVLRGEKRRIVADVCRRSGYPIDDPSPGAG